MYKLKMFLNFFNYESMVWEFFFTRFSIQSAPYLNWFYKKIINSNYKNICNQQPPPNLDKCEEARWQLRKAKQCRDLRQAWDDRWFPGRHAQEIKNWNRRVKNLEKWIEKNCEGCDAKES